MDCYVGIDLGSTTTKAVFMDSDERILGKGITNSKSNYEVACQVAREEAEINSRFNLLQNKFDQTDGLKALSQDLMAFFTSKFELGEHLKQLAALKKECLFVIETSAKFFDEKKTYYKAIDKIFEQAIQSSDSLFQPGVKSRSDFFRDIASAIFLKEAETVAKELSLSFDRTAGIFDKAILRVENQSFAVFFSEYLDYAREKTIKEARFKPFQNEILKATQEVGQLKFNIINSVGTGYGRLTLPFPKRQIRSEILCHGLGAHTLFPKTSTVLDIGGQDTKAIQVDPEGVVTGFQMNDRCAAGCGRYLGYIADEMNMGLHELGPLALHSKKPARINSTCTVFAGAELRERLSLGEKREDILAGLHRAIILRAMSLIARSGGATSEFTFTGGVAKNEAATNVLKQLLQENYGDLKINISPDSIYMGALGAALFAKRDPAPLSTGILD